MVEDKVGIKEYLGIKINYSLALIHSRIDTYGQKLMNKEK
jgi:hypothetical protein